MVEDVTHPSQLPSSHPAPSPPPHSPPSLDQVREHLCASGLDDIVTLLTPEEGRIIHQNKGSQVLLLAVAINRQF